AEHLGLERRERGGGRSRGSARRDEDEDHFVVFAADRLPSLPFCFAFLPSASSASTTTRLPTSGSALRSISVSRRRTLFASVLTCVLSSTISGSITSSQRRHGSPS